jgi:hypothetical protein
MRDNVTSPIFLHAKKYYDLLRSQNKEIHDVHVVTENCIMMTFSAVDEYNEGNPVSNLAIVAFTTSHARPRLLSVMRKLGERVLYYDTNSVMYVSRSGDEEPEKVEMLGFSVGRGRMSHY